MTDSDSADQKFKYDIAFSFASADEPLVRELNALLIDQVITFYYAERQRELAGTDGEQSFGDVFEHQARIVVILFRAEWGQTPWTRIEETAIRNRAYNDGYDFVTVIPTVPGVQMPRWLPRTRLWLDKDRFGLKAAASIIQTRAEEAGSTVRRESVLDHGERLARTLRERGLERAFHESERGVAEAKDQAEKVKTEIARLVEQLAAGGLKIPFTPSRDMGDLLVSRGVAGLSIGYRGRFANTLNGAELVLRITRGAPPRPNAVYYEDPPPPLLTKRYLPIGGSDAGFRWAEKGNEENTFTSELLAEHAVKLLLEQTDRLSKAGERGA
jgi:hypothetical protein